MTDPVQDRRNEQHSQRETTDRQGSKLPTDCHRQGPAREQECQTRCTQANSQEASLQHLQTEGPAEEADQQVRGRHPVPDQIDQAMPPPLMADEEPHPQNCTNILPENKIMQSYAHGSVVNISNYDLSQLEISALSKTLKFCPTPPKTELSLIMDDIDEFIRKVKLRIYFMDDELIE